MCFDQKSSFGFAIFGLLVAAKLYHKTRDWAISGSVFFFFTMELLQGFQYFWIDDCDHPMNKFLTLLGLLHICCQPFFLNLINSRTTHSTRIKNYFTVILRLCVVGGLWLFSRMIWGYIYGWNDPITGRDQSTEWLRGAKLCTFSGRFHLAWETPMADASYFVPGVALHSFLMFAPLLCVKWNTVPVSVFLFLTGLALAAWITPNQHEQASIWCFFSIAQIAIIIIGFCYRIHWFGDEKKKRQWAHWMPRRWNYPAKYLQKEAPKASAGGKKKN